jgi:FkbM family methyltransferase
MKNTSSDKSFYRRWRTLLLLLALAGSATAASVLWWRLWHDTQDNCAMGWNIRALYRKVAGQYTYISWADVWRHVTEPCYDELNPQPKEKVYHLEDGVMNGHRCELYQTALGRFWIPAPGTNLLALLLWEIAIQQDYDSDGVGGRPGDTVFDCGAHVGVFTRYCLQRGVKRVIAVEPDPTNLACLEANFAAEIASGQVTIIKAGVWNTKTKLPLFEPGGVNSGGNSFVNRAAPNIYKLDEIPVLPLDEIVGDLKLDRVDFIKMDIEGAERYALEGAAKSIARFKPRMAICTYHLADDLQVIPAIVKRAQPSYQIHGKDVEIMAGRANIKVLFFQ